MNDEKIRLNEIDEEIKKAKAAIIENHELVNRLEDERRAKFAHLKKPTEKELEILKNMKFEQADSCTWRNILREGVILEILFSSSSTSRDWRISILGHWAWMQWETGDLERVTKSWIACLQERINPHIDHINDCEKTLFILKSAIFPLHREDK